MSNMLVDGFVNVATRLGMYGASKSAGGTFVHTNASREEIDAAYRTTWLGKIIDIPAEDMTAQWIEWQTDGDDIEDIEAEIKRLCIRDRITDAIKKGRRYGGAVAIMGIRNQMPQTPLDLDRIALGDLEFVHVATRYEVTAGSIDQSPLSPTYLEPEYYSVTGSTGGIRVHPSRVMRFIGNENPSLLYKDGWGDPVFDRVREKIRDLDATAANVAEMTNEAKIDVVSIPRLMEQIGTKDYEDRLIKRVQTAALIKGTTNTLLIDGGNAQGEGGEKWEQKTLTFQGLPDVIQGQMQMLAGIADIPVTRLFGTSAKGLNATGDGDERNYLKMIASKQDLDLRPALDKLIEPLLRSATGTRDEKTYWKFKPLWVPTAAEAADVGLKEAQADQIYANMNLMPDQAWAEVMQNKLTERGTYPGIEAALTKYGNEPEPPDPITLGLDPETGNPLAANSNSPIGKAANDAAMFTDGVAKTLYVRRDVLNAAEVIAWARSQGIKSTLAADDMHVTVAFSRTPVDWMTISQPWDSKLEIPAGGPRDLAVFGEDALVLMFKSSELEWRHEAMKSAGASWDHPEYQPHITITYESNGLDPASIRPYQGKIELGPELFETVKEDWKAGIAEE